MDTKTSTAKYYNIQTAAELSGLTTHTIRAWEKRYQALNPTRSESGRRLYSEKEVDRLTLLAHLTQLGSSIGQIAMLSDQDLKDIYLKLSKNSLSSAKQVEVHTEYKSEESAIRLLNALKRYDMGEIVSTLEELKSQITPRELALNIFFPMLSELKQLQESNQLTIAQGQALKAVIKFHAGSIIYTYFERRTRPNLKIAITSLEGDYHTNLLLLSTLLCCHHRLNFFYLNANLPIVSIAEAMKAIEATTLILTLGPERIDSSVLEHNLSQLQHSLSEKIKIYFVGLSPEQISKKFHWRNIEFLKGLEELDHQLARIS